MEFDAQISDGYEVMFTLHTRNVSSQNNTSPGTTWYRHTAFNYGTGVCVDNAGPEEDVKVAMHVDQVSGIPDGYAQNAVEWGSWPGTIQIIYKVVWHNASGSEAPEEQPPQQDSQTDSGQPSPPITSHEGTEHYDDEQEDHDSTGILISPFIFKNEATSISASETHEKEQLPQEMIDILDINGTLASYHFLNGMQLYVLSGKWSMAINDTAVFDFNANFTMVRADGDERQTFSLDNLTAVNDSDLILADGTVALTSALDYHVNGTITRVNATIIVEKLNVLKIQMDNMSTPVYGIVDKVIRNSNGETQVMARQLDMI